MAEQGRIRHRALADRLKTQREAREAELKRRGASETELCDQDADDTRMEQLATEVRHTTCGAHAPPLRGLSAGGSFVLF